MRLVGTHYWIIYADDTKDVKHIREIGDRNHTYCNGPLHKKWYSDNMRKDMPIDQICPVCFSLYTLELF